MGMLDVELQIFLCHLGWKGWSLVFCSLLLLRASIVVALQCLHFSIKVLDSLGLLLQHVELLELLHHCGLVKLQLGGLHLVKGVVARVCRFLWALEGN